ncbi:S-layer homology domain-containing protein [Paenibacillus dendritiformis]|uniref:S-layer homology domain-containing protein n=1 Tax=Paenibacillus dendritiformis TaxID=130049 RepID=UPI00364D35A7
MIGRWAEASIRRVIDAGLVGGRNTGFAPNESNTRAEIADVVDRMLKRGSKGLGQACSLLDEKSRRIIPAALLAHVFISLQNKTFKGTEPV